MAKGNEILIKLTADNAKLKQGLEEAKRQVNKTTSDIEKSGSRLAGALKSIGTVVAGFLGLHLIKNLANTAKEVNNVTKGFENLASTAKGGSEGLLKAMQIASKGMISQVDIMKSANLAMQLMGSQVTEYLPKMAEIATAVAKAQGKDAAEMLNDIVVASGRQSVMILDNLGVSSVRAGQLMEEYAAKLGKTREQLSDSERSAAFFYATMKAGEEVMQRSGGITEDAATKIARFEASMKNLYNSISMLVLPALAKLAELITKITDALQKEIDTYNEFAALVDTGKVDVTGIWTKEAIEGTKWFKQQYQEVEKFYNDKYKWEQRNQELLAKGYTQEEINAKKRKLIYEEVYKRFYSLSQEAQKGVILGSKKQVPVAKQATGTSIGEEANYINYAKEFEEAAQKVAEGFEKIRQAAIAGDLQATAKAMEELQKQGLLTANTNTVFSQSIAQMAYDAKVQNVAIEEIAGAFNNLETATKQSLYEMMWGKNGWDKFQQAFKNIIKQMVADIVYLTIKMAALQAIMSATGLGTFGAGGGFVGKVLGKIFERGYIPAYPKGRIPAYPSGYIPQDHFLAYIGTKEAVIRKEATQANRDILAWMNANNGQRLPLDINLTSIIQVDGNEIGRVVDKYRDTIQSLTGYKNYYRKSL